MDKFQFIIRKVQIPYFIKARNTDLNSDFYFFYSIEIIPKSRLGNSCHQLIIINKPTIFSIHKFDPKVVRHCHAKFATVKNLI